MFFHKIQCIKNAYIPIFTSMRQKWNSRVIPFHNFLCANQSLSHQKRNHMRIQCFLQNSGQQNILWSKLGGCIKWEFPKKHSFFWQNLISKKCNQSFWPQVFLRIDSKQKTTRIPVRDIWETKICTLFYLVTSLVIQSVNLVIRYFSGMKKENLLLSQIKQIPQKI